MSTFDELMNQLNYEDDTFESELLSLIDNDNSMYSEANIDKDAVADAKKVYNKAKKIKKACIIALGLIAAIIAGAAIYKKVQKNKKLKGMRDSYKQIADMDKRMISQKFNDQRAAQYEGAKQEAENLKKQATHSAKILQQSIDDYSKAVKSGNDRTYSNWLTVAEGRIAQAKDILKKIANLGETFDDSKITNLTDRLETYISNDKDIEKFIKSSADTVLSGYNDFMENAVTEYLDDNISFTELCALSVKASQKFDDSSYNESAYNDEYSRIVDSICEKYNNDELSPDDTVLLLEKAAEKYLG